MTSFPSARSATSPGILQMRAGDLDLGYVAHRVQELGLVELCYRARSDAQA